MSFGQRQPKDTWALGTRLRSWSLDEHAHQLSILVTFWTFLSPEPMILLACGRDRGLWPDPIFWVCAEYSFRILSQSDLPDLTGSPWIADFRCWTSPELSIPAAGQKDRGLWGRECFLEGNTEYFSGSNGALLKVEHFGGEMYALNVQKSIYVT